MIIHSFFADKQLKKSIKRIEKELQALGLNAEILRELLSGGPLEDDAADSQQASSPSADRKATVVPSYSPNNSPSLRKSGSSRSLSKTQGLAAKRAKRNSRRQARARAEYELAGRSFLFKIFRLIALS